MASPLSYLITLDEWDGTSLVPLSSPDRYVFALLLDEDASRSFGCRGDDFACGRVVFRAPGLLLEDTAERKTGSANSVKEKTEESRTKAEEETHTPKGYILTFTHDLFGSTPLEDRLGEYTFSHYFLKEALHLSCREKHLLLHDLEELRHEMDCDIDDYTRRILTDHLQLLLDHTARYYHRQFITRENCNQAHIGKLSWFLATYTDTHRMQREGLPTIADAADVLNHSTAYTLDLLRHETGLTWEAYLFNFRTERAKSMLLAGTSVTDIVSTLHFRSTPFFSALFRRLTGLTPTQFRHTS